MRWGQRKKQIAKDRYDLADKYTKQYGVTDAYDKWADYGYGAAINRKWSETKYKKLESDYRNLLQKSQKQVTADMRQKYGKDYDRFVRGEHTKRKLISIGVSTGYIATLSAGAIAIGRKVLRG